MTLFLGDIHEQPASPRAPDRDPTIEATAAAPTAEVQAVVRPTEDVESDSLIADRAAARATVYAAFACDRCGHWTLPGTAPSAVAAAGPVPAVWRTVLRRPPARGRGCRRGVRAAAPRAERGPAVRRFTLRQPDHDPRRATAEYQRRYRDLIQAHREPRDADAIALRDMASGWAKDIYRNPAPSNQSSLFPTDGGRS